MCLGNNDEILVERFFETAKSFMSECVLQLSPETLIFPWDIGDFKFSLKQWDSNI